MEETQKEKQAAPEPIDIITLLHDVLRGVKKLWWACLLLTVLCAAGSWYTAKRAYRPMYRAAASFTVATGSGESGGFSYGFYYNTATASQLARTFAVKYIIRRGRQTWGAQHTELNVAQHVACSLRVTINSGVQDIQRAFGIRARRGQREQVGILHCARRKRSCNRIRAERLLDAVR